MRRGMLLIVSALALAALGTGCRGFEVTQRIVFANDRGDVVTVDFGRSEKKHVNWFVSQKGEKLPFPSQLVVRVTLPDGRDFVAWQCMNPEPRGTLYKTDDDKWAFMANGFSCIVYEGNVREFRPVYYGLMCESPKVEVEKNDKWRTMDKPVAEIQRSSRAKGVR